MTALTTQTQNKRELQRNETQRILSNRALFQKVLRMLDRGLSVQIQDHSGGDYRPVVKVELSGDRFLGYRDRNESPLNGISGDHVLIDGKKYYLNVTSSEPIDPAVEMLDLATALNSMMDFRTGSVFIACSFYNSGDDFFLVRHFQTDGSSLCVIAAQDGRCHDIVPGCGWVYDLRYRRYVYGEGGPLLEGI